MSYQSFDFSFPTRICFGVGESEKAAEYAEQLHPGKIMVLTYADIRLPVLDKLLQDLDEKKIPYALYDRCTGNPKAEQIDAATQFCVENGCDMVLGVGGGSVIDSAKAAAMMAVNPVSGGVWTYVSGEAEPENHALPIMLVVTIASTGSESNESFVLTDKDEKQKLIYNNPMVRPTLSICDPVLSVTLPARQTALGAADVLSHVMEQYLHCDPAVDVSDNMCLGVMEAVVRWAPVAIAQPENLDARSNLLWASILAMSRILGVGHEENWMSHLLEHAVSARYNIAHAAGMTGILPAYLRWLQAN
ncbi:MAG: iron-containing alcohol dehydrogenase, partial [Clostridia bacterium]|nr:iron-containing alcohol dehydrogenase [Clostridia bacterium]